MNDHHLKLKDWIDHVKINLCLLSSNPNAIHLLESNLDKTFPYRSVTLRTSQLSNAWLKPFA